MNHEREHIIKTIESALIHQFEFPADKISRQTDFFNDLDFSMMQFSELTTYLETELQEKIFDRFTTSFTTVEHLADYVSTKLDGIRKLKSNKLKR